MFKLSSIKKYIKTQLVVEGRDIKTTRTTGTTLNCHTMAIREGCFGCFMLSPRQERLSVVVQVVVNKKDIGGLRLNWALRRKNNKDNKDNWDNLFCSTGR